MKKILFTAAFFLASCSFYAQVGIGTTTPDASSILELKSADKGFLMPRMATSVRTGITSPAAGLQVYDTTTKSVWYHNGTSWINTVVTPGWGLSGNAGTTPGTNFIGTTDSQDVVFKRNNNRSGLIGLLNTSFGNTSLASLSTGNANTAVGSFALSANTTGGGNTSMGYYALSGNGVGMSNIGIGEYALMGNSNGNSNIAIGTSTMRSNVAGEYNTALGGLALYSTTGSNNVAIGYNAGYSTTGSSNVFIGNAAGQLLTNVSNRFIVSNSNTSTPLLDGDFVAKTLKVNGALTATALASTATVTTGRPVVADANGQLMIGTYDLVMYGTNNHVTQDSGDSGSGWYGSGSNNIGIGKNALRNATTGSSNIALGINALRHAVEGDHNIILGSYAGTALYGGNKNIALGYNAGTNAGMGDNNVFIGTNTGYNATQQGVTSNQLFIGNATTIAGVGGTTAGVGGYDALVRGDFATKVLTINNTLKVTDLRSTATATTGNRPVVADANGQLMIGTAPTILKGSATTTATGLIDVGDTLETSITLAGAAVSGVASVSPRVALPNGIAIAYVRISAANTVTIGFQNNLGNGSSRAVPATTFDIVVF